MSAFATIMHLFLCNGMVISNCAFCKERAKFLKLEIEFLKVSRNDVGEV